MQLESRERHPMRETRIARLLVCVALVFSVPAALTACSIDIRDLGRHDVTLTQIWDTEAATILTSQKDVSSTVCGEVSRCVDSLSSDQAQIFKFRTSEDAEAELREGDVQIREIFIVRWTAEVPQQDREYVEYMLLSAGNST